MSRQIVLDTETTGLDPKDGHRVIEIGCVEQIDRRLTGNNFHKYLQPDRVIDAEAIGVHGITNEYLLDKPRFPEIVDEFMAYIDGAELIIHNAPFDVGFLENELNLLNSNWKPLADYCTITDSLVMARKKHPGQRNSLDALCQRYDVINTHRQLHGALLDAEILADVYRMMTGGQRVLLFDGDASEGDDAYLVRRISADRISCPVVLANADELVSHESRLSAISKTSEGALWLSIDDSDAAVV